MLLQGLCTADAATGCPGSPLSALQRAALVVAEAPAIAPTKAFPLWGKVPPKEADEGAQGQRLPSISSLLRVVPHPSRLRRATSPSGGRLETNRPSSTHRTSAPKRGGRRTRTRPRIVTRTKPTTKSLPDYPVLVINKGVLRTVGSKSTFAYFSLTRKVGRRRQNKVSKNHLPVRGKTNRQNAPPRRGGRSPKQGGPPF